VAKGTIIVIGQSGFVTTKTPIRPIFLVVKATNAIYFSGTIFALAGTSDAIQIKNASTPRPGVSGDGQCRAIPSPGPLCGELGSGNTIYFNEDTVPEPTNTAN
jgi:hypothetical protein